MQRKSQKSKIKPGKSTPITIVFPYGTGENEIEELCCPISLRIMLAPMETIDCSHVFDAVNILMWIGKSRECPVCRTQITDLKNIEKEHDLLKKLQEIKIIYKRKTHTYTEFIEKEYNIINDFEMKYEIAKRKREIKNKISKLTR